MSTQLSINLPAQDHDHGFMYGRCVEDPDGNVSDVMWMDRAAAGGAQ